MGLSILGNQEEINQKISRNDDRTMNFVMFGVWGFLIPIAACAFVLLFLEGTLWDLSVLTMTVMAIIIKLFEKKLGQRAKYFYACIMPICGTITMIADGEGRFGAMTQAYFLTTVMIIAYYNLSVVKLNFAMTIIATIIGMLLGPEAYTNLHKWIVWIFIGIVYILLGITVYAIVVYTNSLYSVVEKREDKVLDILSNVQSVSEKLSAAGAKLSYISENESASAEELAATSEQLVESSRLLSQKTDESMENLSELSEWEGVVAENVEQVEITSKDLLNKSVENEKLLSDLHTINEEVSEAMNVTTSIAKKLSDAVQEIGTTLNLINEISSSTNLLALNASIEAARAGEAGRGFAVVATEVGNLANSTQQSLKDVENVITRVQNNVKEITTQIEVNSSKLGTQNEYYANVFKSMQNMTELFNVSAKAIDTMGQAHHKQAEVIRKTISINQDIDEGIKNVTEQFDSINAMAESNANDTTEVIAQANVINDMVEEMTGLLA